MATQPTLRLPRLQGHPDWSEGCSIDQSQAKSRIRQTSSTEVLMAAAVTGVVASVLLVAVAPQAMSLASANSEFGEARVQPGCC